MKTFAEIYAESSTNATLTVGYADKAGELRALSRGKVGPQGPGNTWYSFVYDGDTGVLSLGNLMLGLPGKIVMGVASSGQQSILLDSATGTIALGGRNVGNGTVRLSSRYGIETAVMNGETATLTLGNKSTSSNDRADGKIVLRGADGAETIVLEGGTGNLTLGGGAQDGDLVIKSANGTSAVVMNGSEAELTLGGSGLHGNVRVKNGDNSETVSLDGQNGNLTLGGGAQDGDLSIRTASGKVAIAMSGSLGLIRAGGEGVNGDIVIKNSNDIETIKITGSNGDIEFLNADVAEEFEVHAAHVDEVLPGTVMVLEESGRLMPCSEPYDSRVVGIVAGAGHLRPGIVLDKNGGRNRRAIALVGKTYCRVDAGAGTIRVGDMLTTSPRKGHAMRASDRVQAFGAVIGKALEGLSEGVGLIPVLVKPQ